MTKKHSFHVRLESLNHHAAAFHDLAIADVQLQEEEWDQLNFLFHRPDVDVTKTKSQMNRETVSFGPIVYNALSSSDSVFWGGGLENERGWVVMGFTRVFQFFPFVMFRWMDVFDSTNRSAKCSLWSGFRKDGFAKAARGTCIRSTEEYGVKQILID